MVAIETSAHAPVSSRLIVGPLTDSIRSSHAPLASLKRTTSSASPCTGSTAPLLVSASTIARSARQLAEVGSASTRTRTWCSGAITATASQKNISTRFEYHACLVAGTASLVAHFTNGMICST